MMNDQENTMGLAAPAGADIENNEGDVIDKSGAQQSPASGAIDTKQIEAGVEVPPKLKPALDRIVLSGMRIMFSKETHKMLLDELNQPGPLTDRMVKGIIPLMYLLWTQSNKTIPPQLIVPSTVIMTLRAFDYVQQTGDPEATKETLGDALDGAVTGVMERFGVDTNNLPGALQQATKAGQAGQSPQQPAPQEGGLAAPTAQPAAPQPGGGIMGMGA